MLRLDIRHGTLQLSHHNLCREMIGQIAVQRSFWEVGEMRVVNPQSSKVADSTPTMPPFNHPLITSNPWKIPINPSSITTSYNEIHL